MSRGAGKWQRLILERVESGPVFVRQLGTTQTEISAIHRAAHALAKAGKVDLHERLHPRYDKRVLVATLPGVVPPEREPSEILNARSCLANPMVPLWRTWKAQKLLKSHGINVDEIVLARGKSRPHLSREEFMEFLAARVS